MPEPKIEIYSSLQEVVERGARLLRQRVEATDPRSGLMPFRLALSGGRTPAGMFDRLRELELSPEAIARLHIFWADERCVPPDDPRSNYHLAWDLWLRHLPLAPEQIHRIHAERGEEAAALYEREIRAHFGLRSRGYPRFDLILLGLGEDGHTASLFPKTGALSDRRLATYSLAPYEPRERISLTLPVLNRAKEVVFLVSGAAKAEALRRVLEEGPMSGLPAALVRPKAGEIRWLVDQEAARLLR